MTGESEDMTAKERLLLWSKQITEGYVGVRCDNFTTSWRDGRLFNAIIHKYRYCNVEGTPCFFVVTPFFFFFCIFIVSLSLSRAGRTWLT